MENKKWYTDALMVNRDPNWYGAIDETTKETCIKSITNYFMQYEGAVTDVMLGVHEQTTIVPSEAFMWRGDKYLQKTENGHEVDYSNNAVRGLYYAYREYGVDPVQIFLDCMHKLGIRPWLTLRMNDCHFGGEPTSFLHSDLFYEELEAGHIIGTEKYGGWFGYCRDFSYPKYRTALLGYIKELVNKYDMFGLELDFMRSIQCFDYKSNPDCHKIMTEYFRQIKELVSAAEKRVGHDIKISVRTCSDPVCAKEFGFDIKTLADEALVDVVVPTAYYSPTNSGMPIKEWRELLGDDVAIIAGIETNSFKGYTQTLEHSKAHAAAYYADGADGIYYNNHEYYYERNRKSWTLTRENCTEGHREFVVTFDSTPSRKELQYKPLPMVLDGTADLPLRVGKLKAKDAVKVIIDFEGEEYPTLSVGDKKAAAETVEPYLAYKGLALNEKIAITEHQALSYDISGVFTDNPITLTFNGKGTVHYVNIVIDAE